jgi:hypothetical protein
MHLFGITLLMVRIPMKVPDIKAVFEKLNIDVRLLTLSGFE